MGSTGRLHPQGVPCFFSSQYIKGLGKLPFWYTKGSQTQLQSGRSGGQSKVYQKMPHFGRNDYATESERLKTGKNEAISGNSIVLA